MSAREIFPLRSGLWHMGRFADRQDELRREAERDPKSFGLKLVEESRFEEAEPILRWASELHPASAEVYFALGRALWESSRWTESVPVFAKAVELSPDSKEMRFHYADALLRLGRFADAEKEFRWVANREPLRNKVRRRWAKLFKDDAPTPTVNPASEDVHAKLAFCTARKTVVADARKKILTRDKLNAAWKRTERGRKLTVKNTPLIRPGTRIFTMGSCFALEIRHELLRRGFDVYPKYSDIIFDQTTQILDSLPDRDNINHYDTFTIRQEIELALGGAYYKPEDFWQVRDASINKVMRRETVFQDPYRKNIYASTAADIVEVSKKIGDAIVEGLMRADVYVFTLGLIEAWLNTANGLHVCCYPGVGGGGGSEQTKLHVSNFQENYENLRRVCELIFGKFPGRHIIFTVSPVALERTFRDEDVVVANMESKSQLRAVAGQICREFPNAHYLPSYELFVYHDLFHDNGRHATRDGVETVVGLFARKFMELNTDKE